MRNLKRRLSPISTMHYCKLFFRSALFLAALVVYFLDRSLEENPLYDDITRWPGLFVFIWVVYILEMILRFFPSRLESPGCQKQFARNYIKSGQTEIAIQDNNGTVLVLLIWIGFNGHCRHSRRRDHLKNQDQRQRRLF